MTQFYRVNGYRVPMRSDILRIPALRPVRGRLGHLLERVASSFKPTPRPRYCLWGWRAGYIQVGSRQDRTAAAFARGVVVSMRAARVAMEQLRDALAHGERIRRAES